MQILYYGIDTQRATVCLLGRKCSSCIWKVTITVLSSPSCLTRYTHPLLEEDLLVQYLPQRRLRCSFNDRTLSLKRPMQVAPCKSLPLDWPVHIRTQDWDLWFNYSIRLVVKGNFRSDVISIVCTARLLMSHPKRSMYFTVIFSTEWPFSCLLTNSNDVLL